ncbi:MAG: hypothetical protein NC084_01710 [Bacteroides sp.]|nr:hypothetical protein [Eubacterium sp.]MCM1417397.1 hypothetical protein [Roseburia sp.]MCM1461410.1 hypothetical protein [Bacteroides sp.]
MNDFSEALRNSLKYGSYDDGEINDLISAFEKQLHVVLKDDEPAWVQLCDRNDGRLVVLMHRVYKIAFVRSNQSPKLHQIYIQNVESFDDENWYIDDFERFVEQFPYLHWDEPWEEPKCYEERKTFSLLDMRFDTE